ncbi:MAG: hypothetical protein KAR05_11825 [Candidatus Omnitrophica bacterium]|nr:hypothetical protein [Candidatus Omnitrophota bacterium]
MLSPRRKKYTVFFVACFSVCFSLGIWLSTMKDLWNDELYTQSSSVERTGVVAMLKGEIAEGNNSPLFYLLQKGITSLANIHLSDQWTGSWTYRDVRSQALIRLFSNFFMSAALTIIAVYFFWNYSRRAGVYAFLTALSSYMVWAYWIEARPYALWFFLTTLQSLLLLELFKQKKPLRVTWRLCVFVHILMSFTIVFSFIQIVIASLLLWLLKERDWRRYVLMTIFPAVVCLFYYSQAPRYQFWFADNPVDLIAAGFPKERMLMILLYAGFLGAMYKRKNILGDRLLEIRVKKESKGYFYMTLMTLCSAVAVLMLLKSRATSGDAGFQISNRYFIYLTPISIMMTVIIALEFMSMPGKNTRQRTLVIAFLGGLLLLRVYRTYMLAKGVF